MGADGITGLLTRDCGILTEGNGGNGEVERDQAGAGGASYQMGVET
jgi:hypothetical protein